ncbi:ferritin family protein [Halarsenatibacter silvermanii]|uniref:Rubrerythrin n=1 Tax=Halarsenatibacter silvermanii TaxID=321763 RepID=A0A1G9N0A9_9FIRM|nr:ferritin family protein [Halarsenatibacter silvermanii]SDL79577.1 Rubrerythrin [Halarsenatibacter silvermanii]
MSELLETIEEAIQDERDAQQKYRKLKKLADDEETQQLYEQLISDEKQHEKILRSRYEALKESRE